MAQYATIKLSQLKGCMSADRYFGGCSECLRVGRCKLPEAVKGRQVLAEQRIKRCKEELKKARRAYRRLLKKDKEVPDVGTTVL